MFICPDYTGTARQHTADMEDMTNIAGIYAAQNLGVGVGVGKAVLLFMVCK